MMRNFEGIYQKAISKGLIHEQDDSVIFYDHEMLVKTLRKLKEFFPSGVQHTIAVKTNSLPDVLTTIGKEGMGHEAASYGEVMKAAHKSDGLIVYDGPAKTKRELKELEPLSDRLLINANSYYDLEKILTHPFKNIGLRINMQVSTDVHAIFDVSHKNSKFGVPLSAREDILAAYVKYPDLNALHFHLGSGITSVEPYRKALSLARDLLNDIRDRRRMAGLESQIQYLDMGGGLLAEQQSGCFDRLEQLGRMIKEEFNDITEQYTLVTEFGQNVHTHNSWLYSRIADILPHTDPETLILYQGANMFVRQAYTDQKPPFQYYIMGKEDLRRTHVYDLAGPLCFSGDYIAKGVSLPKLEMQDGLIIEGIGANTYSLWSEHCSWERPKVVGVEGRKSLKVKLSDNEELKKYYGR